MGYDHPISWCKEIKSSKARIWFSGFGSASSDWTNGQIRDHILGGLSYISGASNGDCTASLDEYYEKTILARYDRLHPNRKRLQFDVAMRSTPKEPLQIDISADGRVFWIDRSGTLRIYDPTTTAVKIAARFNVTNDVEDGLLGFALDFNFTQTQHVYAYYSPAGTVSESKLSRFTMSGDTLLLNTEKVLFTVATQRKECCHSGSFLKSLLLFLSADASRNAAGQILLDRRTGHLFLTLGDNTSPYGESDSYAPLDDRPGWSLFDSQRTAANTQDLRGKILRIVPNADGGYSIPSGNLFPNPNNGRPEIYVMGVRNPYRMAVDPLTGYVESLFRYPSKVVTLINTDLSAMCIGLRWVQTPSQAPEDLEAWTK